jgi:NAD(P)-dependent dehydrogenase (short-subunit alcohol dehydrogenase family)
LSRRSSIVEPTPGHGAVPVSWPNRTKGSPTPSNRLSTVPPLELEGRTALVTGASRGIGAATAKALDRAGARVAMVARRQEDLETLAAEMKNDPVVVAADLSQPEAPADIASRALLALGAVDVLVNNAALAARIPTVETTGALIDQMLALNVRAPLLLIAALVPAMAERKRGSIINLSSVSALVGTPKRAAYAASKGAIDAATRSLAMELGPSGVRVNSVAPGAVDTAMWASNRKVPGVIEAVEAVTPLRRWATADDVADVIVFLASDSSRFVTGETISPDGGMAHTLDLYGGPV